MKPAAWNLSQRRQRGATTLVVVMALFLVVAMLAAFASRNMVYEQRIASNYYRAGVAYEAAEAGVEWALGMVNADRIDTTCQNNAAGDSLRERYLNINQSSRAITPVSASPNVMLACHFTDANTWTCQCPTPTAAAPGALVMPVLGASGLQPMFGVGFKAGTRPGTARLTVIGCTGLITSCANNLTAAGNALGKAEQAVDIALVSAVKMPPISPLVAKGLIDPGSPAALGLFNSAPNGPGMLVQTGRLLSLADLAHAEGIPGTPASDYIITADTAMRDQTVELFFASFFGMNKDYYRNQPKMRQIAADVCGSDCSDPLQTQIAAGAQMFWLNAASTFSSNVTLGGPTNPVVIIVDGDLTISQPIQIYGLLYVRGNLSWTNPSGAGIQATVTGAVVAEGNVTVAGPGPVNMVYDGTVMQILNNQRGSFVRVPGSTWDQAR
ncbi:hypothetical protein J7U46_00430 [Pelomonas sp. V22]|uniref:pilus assembly PilX family protein n=1 Tax=Pelomonas sp. V22 TaxID=2822139 RepID=UPI0024A8A4FB|nr:PilX N-terminal domain-containing pilus assembly protein [Pelomonas sp. V22]MDI4631508.1 hypothetical protein [Pelomonas sp. V22]